MWSLIDKGCLLEGPTSTTRLMADRATCRISRQHVAKWLLHGW